MNNYKKPNDIVHKVMKEIEKESKYKDIFTTKFNHHLRDYRNRTHHNK